MKKIVCILICVMIVAAISFTGCTQGNYEPMDLVPEGANMVIDIDLLNTMANADRYAESSAGADMAAYEEMMDSFTGETGLDPGDVKRMVVFGDISGMDMAGTPAYMGMIIQGTFENGGLVQRFEEQAGEQLTAADYKGYSLYTSVSGESAYVALSDTIVIIGTPRSVKDCIDVAGGDASGAGGLLIESYNRIGDALVRMAMVLPEGFSDSMMPVPGTGMLPDGDGLFEDMEMPEGMESVPGMSLDSSAFGEAFGSMDAVAFALDQDLDLAKIRMELHTGSAQAAADAADALESVLMLFAGFSADTDMNELLGRMDIGTSGQWVRISMDLTMEDLEELRGMSGSMLPDMMY